MATVTFGDIQESLKSLLSTSDSFRFKLTACEAPWKVRELYGDTGLRPLKISLDMYAYP